MPDEYISREAALTALQDSDLFNTTERQLRAIRELPAADVAPVRHARWQRYGKNLGECLECGEIVSVRSNYCPNCGAKMDGGKDDEAD